MPTRVLGAVGVKGMGSCPAGATGLGAGAGGVISIGFGVTTGRGWLTGLASGVAGLGISTGFGGVMGVMGIMGAGVAVGWGVIFVPRVPWEYSGSLKYSGSSLCFDQTYWVGE